MLLSVEDLTTVFTSDKDKNYVVNEVSFSIGAGKTFALLGESGCGKSITALSLLNLLPENASIIHGSIMFSGEDLVTVSQSRLRQIRGNHIGMIFQEPMSSLNPLMCAGDQIAEALMHHEKLSKKDALKQACSLLQHVGIPDAHHRLYSYPHELSGGMQQRVMIAMALAASPELLIADEPTTALDVTIQAQILELLNSLKKTDNLAMLLISHDLGVVAECADEVGVMYCGRIVERALVADLFMHPLHPYTIGLHKAIPHIDKKVNELETIAGFVPPVSGVIPGCSFHPRCKRAAQAGACAKDTVVIQLGGENVKIPLLCATQTPPLREISPTHFCACWEVT